MRKISLLLAALAMLLLLAACGDEPKQEEAATEEPVTITLTYANFPPASTFPCVQMERWKEEVEKRTNGKVKVQTFPGSTLLGPKNMFKGVQDGQADIGNISTAYFPGVFTVMNGVNLPLGFTSSTVASMTLWDYYENQQPKELDGVKVLTVFCSAPSNIMSKVPVRSLDDMKGLELRASGSILQILAALGGQGVGMPMSQTPEALQKGVVQGLVSSLEVLMDFNFAELCRYETITNMPVYPFVVIMNKAKWDALPDDVKQVMDDLGREQALWTGQYMDKHIDESLAWSKDKYQIEVIKLSEEETAKIRGLASGLVDEWKAEATGAGLDAEALLADIMALKTKYEAEYGK